MGATSLSEDLSPIAVEGLVVGHEQSGYWASSVLLDEFQQIIDLWVNLEFKTLGFSVKKDDVEWEGLNIASFDQLTRMNSRLGTDLQAGTKLGNAEWGISHESYQEVLECLSASIRWKAL
ncbi:MAG: hypothetical protein Q7K57_06165 [Burkholderiaceae bacterium]|nr:hypothetical protein [Burkholderiaceae bacterium]